MHNYKEVGTFKDVVMPDIEWECLNLYDGF